jgi:hypothetical protein
MAKEKASTADIPVASVRADMLLWIRFRGKRQICRVVATSTNPRNFRRMTLELQAPNGVVFPRTFHESNQVQKIIQE